MTTRAKKSKNPQSAQTAAVIRFLSEVDRLVSLYGSVIPGVASVLGGLKKSLIFNPAPKAGGAIRQLPGGPATKVKF